MSSGHQKATMKQKQHQEVAVTVSSLDNKSKKTKSLSKKAPDSSDEDSELEQNFALLSKRSSSGISEEDKEESGREEEEDSSSGGEALEDDSDEEEANDEDDAEVENVERDGTAGTGGDDDEDQTGLGSDTEDSEDVEDVTEQPETINSGEIQTKDDIKKELSTMSFEDILELQNKVGTKVYNEIAYGTTKVKQTPTKKRLNKNRPMEISAKRPVPFLRQVVPVKKTVSRDPRFDDLSGEYKPEIFEKTYRFINDIKQRERDVVQKKLKKPLKSNQKKEKLQFLLKRMENQERARKSREQQREKELEFKRKQREMAGQGLKPFFLKKSDKKKLELAEKYSELKKSGKLENFLSKKRKRNAGKDRRKLPFQQK
ncbi:ribosomal RNA processing protein 36 homolog [Coregonus clupeaformis]|uniref:ribosomal RNA processing protein 36 homolog n=1 Tax=Coregonus clupeaformis TaxID=59861 RepID=UPI001E1C6196|nr:ribosomal RNA processing protein 36 homolog [Coregonus clupeaformis]